MKNVEYKSNIVIDNRLSSITQVFQQITGRYPVYVNLHSNQYKPGCNIYNIKNVTDVIVPLLKTFPREKYRYRIVKHNSGYENRLQMRYDSYCLAINETDKKNSTIFLYFKIIKSYKHKRNMSVYMGYCTSSLKSKLKAKNLEVEIGSRSVNVSQPSPVKTITLLTQTSSGLNNRQFKINGKFDNDDIVKYNYGSDFERKHAEIVASMKDTGKSGIYLFHGDPGTGKTSYIKYLLSTIDRNFYYMPLSIANAGLDSPEIIEYMLGTEPGIMVIEDAETLIANKDGQDRSAALAALLNLADGLLSSVLSFQFIITFNTNISKIDNAILRHGRLLNRHDFKPLSAEDTLRWVKHWTGKEDISDKLPATGNSLATLYNTYNVKKCDIVTFAGDTEGENDDSDTVVDLFRYYDSNTIDES